MITTHTRPRIVATPAAAWRKRPGMSGWPSAEPGAERLLTAVVLSVGDSGAETVCAALTGLHVAIVVRSFDADAAGIVSAVAPDMLVLACDPTRTAAIEAIALLARQGHADILVVDTGAARRGATAALDAGADVVLSADEDPSIVRATLQAILRRSRRRAPAVPWREDLRPLIGSLTVDRDTFEVRDGGELVRFTPTEFKIVADLMLHAGLVRSPSQIMSVLHDYRLPDLEARQTVRVYIRRIRNKLEGCTSPSVSIVSYRTRGYRIEPLNHQDARAAS